MRKDLAKEVGLPHVTNKSCLNIPKMGIIIPNMGTKGASLGEALFTKTQQRVLGLLFGNAERSYYTNEIVRFAEAGIGAVQRELQRLEAAGLITSEKIGNQKHYQANREAPIFEELRGIVVKTFGVRDRLREALEPIRENIEQAFIYGSVARGTDTTRSDIDLMVIADDIDYSALIEVLSEAEADLGRPVNPTLYTRAELDRKLSMDSGFLLRVMNEPRVFVIGNEYELTESG